MYYILKQSDREIDFGYTEQTCIAEYIANLLGTINYSIKIVESATKPVGLVEVNNVDTIVEMVIGSRDVTHLNRIVATQDKRNMNKIVSKGDAFVYKFKVKDFQIRANHVALELFYKSLKQFNSTGKSVIECEAYLNEKMANAIESVTFGVIHTTEDKRYAICSDASYFDMNQLIHVLTTYFNISMEHLTVTSFQINRRFNYDTFHKLALRILIPDCSLQSREPLYKLIASNEIIAEGSYPNLEVVIPTKLIPEYTSLNIEDSIVELFKTYTGLNLNQESLDTILTEHLNKLLITGDEA